MRTIKLKLTKTNLKKIIRWWHSSMYERSEIIDLIYKGLKEGCLSDMGKKYMKGLYSSQFPKTYFVDYSKKIIQECKTDSNDKVIKVYKEYKIIV